MIDQTLFNDVTIILWRQSWQLAVMVALVWLITRTSKGSNPQFSYILWLMVAIKSLIPIQFDTNSLGAISEVTRIGAWINLSELTVGISQNTRYNFGQILALIWLSIAFLLGARLLVNEIRFRRSLREYEPLDLNEIDTLSQSFKLGSSVKVVTGSEIHSPLTIGYFSPVIFLPETFRQLSTDRLIPVIAHEMAHIQRKDLITISIQVVLNILYFFHPFMRVVNQQLDLNRERICDEMAVQALGLNRRQYGRELLAHLEASLKPQANIAFTGGMFLNRKNIIKRFEYLVNEENGIMSKLKISQKIIIGLILSMMVLLSCSDIDTSEKQSELSLASPTEMAKEGSFVEYASPPEPIGGFIEIQKAVKYPESAREAGIEGTVIVQVTIDESGHAINATVLQGVPDSGLNEAAIDALNSIRWQPAKQADDNPVAVTVSVPISFRLNPESSGAKKL